MKSTRSWQMLDKRRYASAVYQRSPRRLTLPQDFEAARVKALGVGAKKFFLEVW